MYGVALPLISCYIRDVAHNWHYIRTHIFCTTNVTILK